MSTVEDLGSMTARLAQRFGPSVAEWCEGVPARVERLERRWGFELGAPLEPGAVSVVFRCRWPDGTPAVLKLSPGAELLAAQAGMLGLFAASGRVPAVLAVDEDALVLEEVLPGTPAEDLPFDGLPALWAELLRALHAVPEQPVGPLRERCEEFLARIGRRRDDPAIGSRVSATIWARTVERCGKLLDTQGRTVVLHGDLHLGNALDGGPRGLVAIDPKACLGDPCFDAADLVVAGPGVEDRCERVAAACGLDGDRLFAWSRVFATLLAIGHLGGGGDGTAVEELLTVAR
ncbi:aminoglycoside phosphotransferase family protein [Lentzea sp.]|uniref:aminoglycoside phosphotransferase family protein n=1 Tax=Lentzea sp. TaxID=56099 RepID=UPI002C6ABDDB|nr:aminoglycoside phosphotransferase family protein [Lentzea sp.]HUQ55754.1 aminoglycoside phosphotransferase family protein [Lentzea sp.]